MLVILRSKSQQKHIFPFNYLPLWKMGTPFFLKVEWGVLQYVAVKPLMALFSLLLGAFGVFKAGDIAFDAGYFYVSFIVNCSQVWAIYCLIMMYLAFAEDLAPIRPIPKMLCIKALIFFTFWQSVLIALLVSIGWLKGSREDVARFEDLVICMEMVAFAIAHHYAFPPEDFSSEDLPAHITTPMLRSLLTAADVTDVIYDLRQGIGPSQSEKPLDQRDMTASTAAIFIANDPYRPANLVRTE
uniref:Transmembrane protein 184C n=2 Tax=Spongospora subterranea TaxID=70186 RepID=A0A0H5QH44_9EUKA|eukprot:CRZ00967.1 hypothetical protein [Spongospora subterranea]